MWSTVIGFVTSSAGKTTLKALLAAAITAGIYFGVRYIYNDYKDMATTVATQESTIETLNTEISRQDSYIEEVRRLTEEQRDIMSDLIAQARVYDEKIRELDQRLNRTGRDIGKMSIAKPGLMQPILQRGVEYRMRCLEIATGAEPTEEDQGNNVCPQLIDVPDNTDSGS